MKRKNNSKGLTLIEMMIVIAIIAVLVSIVTPIVGKATLKSRASTNAANLRAVEGTLSTMRVGNYDAFMTAASAMEQTFGGTGDGTLNSIIPGLGTWLDRAMHTITAQNGTLEFNFDTGLVSVSAPGATECEAEGSKGTNMVVPKDAQMEIYIMDNQIVCLYNGYTKEDFADVAEDGVYDGDGKLSLGEEFQEVMCENGVHTDIDPEDCVCDKCDATAHHFKSTTLDQYCDVCGAENPNFDSNTREEIDEALRCNYNDCQSYKAFLSSFCDAHQGAQYCDICKAHYMGSTCPTVASHPATCPTCKGSPILEDGYCASHQMVTCTAQVGWIIKRECGASYRNGGTCPNASNHN